MSKYKIKLLQRTSRDLDDIYQYIVEKFKEVSIADALIDELKAAIYSLEYFPYRCAKRQRGKFKDKNYRQLLIKNYTIIYRINEQVKEVIIVTIRYSPSDF